MDQGLTNTIDDLRPKITGPGDPSIKTVLAGVIDQLHRLPAGI